MAELVFQNSNGNDVTTSLLVAEVFGKEHSKVVRDIESLSCSASFNAANFGVITYIDSRNREQTAYEMTKDGFSFLVMGYTGSKAGEFKERFINEFNRREALLKDDDYILMRSQQILQKRVENLQAENKRLENEKHRQQAIIELQDKEIKKAAPKVNYYDNHLQSVNALTATQIAKEIGMSAEKLNSKLKELGIQFKQSGQWLLKSPYDKWGMHETRTNIFTSERGNTHTNTYTVWTQRGRRFIIALYENDWNVKKAIKQIKGELNPAA